MNHPIMFLDRNLVSASFSYLLEFLREKKLVIAIISLHLKKLIRLFYLHCTLVRRNSNKENLKLIKNTFSNESGNPKSLKI